MRPAIGTVALSSASVAEPGVREVRDKRFAMVAVQWTGTTPTGIQIQARRAAGHWGQWLDVEELDGPDRGRVAGSEPLWVGHSTALRVRSKGNEELAGLSVVLIDPGTRSGDPAAASPLQPAVISRAGWGADETIRTNCYARQGIGPEYATTVKAATIHHTAGTNNYTAAESASIVRGIYAYHAITNNWCDIGYNVLVDKYGQIFEGRFGGLHRPVWGAHTGGFNQFTFGVSMLGTFTNVAPTTAQIEAVSAIVAWKLAGSYRDPNGQVILVSTGGGTSRYPAGTPVTLPRIFGHRETGYTECPGNAGYQKLPAIRQRVTQLMGNWQSSPIYAKWQSTGADAGSLGGVYELESDAAYGGRWATFASPNLTVYWSSASGAHIVKGAILGTWGRFAREWGIFGYPTTDELPTPDGIGRFSHFAGANGSIYWTPSTGAHETHGAIKWRWASLGWELSYLGYPVSDEYSIPGGRRSDFQHGYITWNATTGAVVDRPY